MKLSAYTLAANCSDESDCQAGIDEIRDFIRYRENEKKKVPDYIYIRLANLKVKLQKYSK